MATMLENYTACKISFEGEMQTSMPGPAQIWQQQELLYRISVLEACQMFARTAPRSADAKDLHWHYQMLDAYFQNLSTERRYGLGANDEVQKRREAAYGNLLNVIADYRKRFGSFAPGGDTECYRKTIAGVIQTVLPVWIQYRQTYIEINKEAVR